VKVADSFSITPRNAEGSPNCKDNIQWFSSSAAEGSGRLAEGLVELHRELEVTYCRLVTVTADNASQTTNIAAGSVPNGLSSSTQGRIVSP
jgi:hypothetical protein